MTATAPDNDRRPTLDPVHFDRAARVRDIFTREAAAFEALLREQPDTPDAASVQPATKTAPTSEPPLSLGMMRLTLGQLVERLEALPEPSRDLEAGIWALKSEQRKLAVLDGYINGLIRG